MAICSSIPCGVGVFSVYELPRDGVYGLAKVNWLKEGGVREIEGVRGRYSALETTRCPSEVHSGCSIEGRGESGSVKSTKGSSSVDVITAHLGSSSQSVCQVYECKSIDNHLVDLLASGHSQRLDPILC